MRDENSVFLSLEVIESRISEKLTVENIANSIYFSKYHYGRLFREIIGDSVMEYVTKRKHTLAGRELLETDATILEIAIKFGFNSHEAFTRSFKAYMGITPTEYRKYRLASIYQKMVRERCTMLYSKATNEIIRELNDFIATAKDTAACARKNEVLEYAPFWSAIADSTDAFADEAKEVLTSIAAIAEHPNEIADRFAIIKTIEDIAFSASLLTFNVNLMVSRGTPEFICIQTPLCERYVALARASGFKAEKIAQFFNELSALIFEDVRRMATEKIDSVIEAGKAAASGIKGYAYIQDEILHIVHELSTISPQKVTEILLEDYLFRLNIISFAADMDAYRSPKDKALFDGIKAFKLSFSQAISFFQTLAKPENDSVLERTLKKHFTDIAFQGNILLFYTRGEVSNEKLGTFLSQEQQSAFQAICCELNAFIQVALNASQQTAYKEIADMLYSIKSLMVKESDALKARGGAVRFLAEEVGRLADSVAGYVEDAVGISQDADRAN